nr:HEAT repeat domain-containing protein [Leptolyngbya sp. FACHB-36]
MILAVEQADSPDRLIAAVRALVAARTPAAIPTLIAVLGYNNPGAAAAAVEGLVQLGEPAVVPLLEGIDDYNYGARASSIRALAAIADSRALAVLVEAAETDFAPSVRRAAAKGLGRLHWTPSPQAEQAQALKTLLLVAQDSDWSIRYAAVVGLDALAASIQDAVSRSNILDQLEQISQTDSESIVQARARLALQQISHIAPLAAS